MPSCKINPLSRGQQLFLQRLLASHVFSDDEAQELFDEINADEELGGRGMGRDLSQCLGIINASLTSGFGLEVRTIALSERAAPPPLPTADETIKEEDGDGDGAGKGKVRRGGAGAKITRYHAVVNVKPDDTAKKFCNHGPSGRSPHELELFRLVLERTVEKSLEGAEADSQASAIAVPSSTSASAGSATGCIAALSRTEAINLRLDLDGPHRNKVGAEEAERVLSALVRERWLVPAPRPTAAASSPDGDEGEDDEGEGEAAARGGSRKKRGGGSRNRESIDGLGAEIGDGRTHLMIGPRTYMELPELLTDIGLGTERLPQFILHGAR